VREPVRTCCIKSRYLPDRRDLNRSFPGSRRGSLASRLAHLFMKEVVEHCTHGIDLHSAGVHRFNLPQIRANLDDPATRRMAKAFGAPVVVQANERDGSLRQSASKLGVPTLLYEAGEALHLDPRLDRDRRARHPARDVAHLGMSGTKPPRTGSTMVAQRTKWVRAANSGWLSLACARATSSGAASASASCTPACTDRSASARPTTRSRRRSTRWSSAIS
jgi:predicted deacylase